MKTTRLITYCSILLFSPQAFSQDTVNSGFGNSGFGTVDVDVPEEEQSGGEQSEGTVDEANGNEYGNESSNDGFNGYITTNDISWKVGALSPQEKLSLIIVVCGGENFEESQLKWGARARSHVNPSEKYRNVLNVQSKVTSAYRPNRKARIEWECPNKGKCDGSCRNQTTNRGRTERDRPKDCDRGKSDVKECAQWNCSCCCHTSSSGYIYTTQSSSNWPNDNDQPDTSGNDNNDDSNEGSNVNRYPSNYNCKGKGIQEERSTGNDDCDCNCNCRLLAELSIYD